MTIYIKKTVVHPRDLKAKAKRGWWKVVRSLPAASLLRQDDTSKCSYLIVRIFFFSMFFFLLCGTGDGTRGTTQSKPLSYTPSSEGRLFNPLPHLFLCPFWFPRETQRQCEVARWEWEALLHMGSRRGSTVRLSLLLKGVGLRHIDQHPGPLLEAAWPWSWCFIPAIDKTDFLLLLLHRSRNAIESFRGWWWWVDLLCWNLLWSGTARTLECSQEGASRAGPRLIYIFSQGFWCSWSG